MKRIDHKKQVRLMLLTLESILRDSRLALKGGPAINLFYRDLPRYSVDIDLCYLNLEDRETIKKLSMINQKLGYLFLIPMLI